MAFVLFCSLLRSLVECNIFERVDVVYYTFPMDDTTKKMGSKRGLQARDWQITAFLERLEKKKKSLIDAVFGMLLYCN